MRIKRSRWKFNYVHQDLFQSFFFKHENRILKLKTRNSVILPLFTNLKVGIHDGFIFFKIIFSNSMIGHKCGEFVRTRRPFRYGKK